MAARITHVFISWMIAICLCTDLQAQEIPRERQKMVMATIEKWHSGKTTHTYLVYNVAGECFKARPPRRAFNEFITGEKFMIAYDTSNPEAFDALNYAHPMFTQDEDTLVTVARVVQTSFSSPVRYNNEDFDWIKFVYYTKWPRRHRSHLRTGYAYFKKRVNDAHNILPDSYFKVVYSPGTPNRCVLHLETEIYQLEKPGITPPLSHYKNRVKYEEMNIKAGAAIVTALPNYNSFHFHFSDPHSYASLDKWYHIAGTVPNYCLAISLPEIVLYRNKYISSFTPLPILNGLVGFGSKSSYFEFNISKGYSFPLGKAIHNGIYKMHPAWKLGTEFSLGVSDYSYTLGEVNSTNDSSIYIGKTATDTRLKIRYNRVSAKAAAGLGIYYRPSSWWEMRLTGTYSYIFAHNNNIHFVPYEKKSSEFVKAYNYVTDANGMPATNDLFSIAPFVVKLEFVFIN